MAHELGGIKYLNFIKEYTHTCYNGNRKKFNDWGYGCNICPACKIRSAGWKSFVNSLNKK